MAKKRKTVLKLPKSHKPGFRVPTAKGSIAFRDEKKYNRKRAKKLIKKEIKNDIQN